MPRPQKPNEAREHLYLESLNQTIFSHASFRAFLSSNIRFLKSGELVVGFIIPDDPVGVATNLHQLLANPVPLQITVDIDESYANDLLETERRLAAL